MVSGMVLLFLYSNRQKWFGENIDHINVRVTLTTQRREGSPKEEWALLLTPSLPPETPAGYPFHKPVLQHNNLTSPTNPDISFAE